MNARISLFRPSPRLGRLLVALAPLFFSLTLRAEMTLDAISMTNVWRYNETTNVDGTGWQQPGYDDSGWAAGPGMLGYDLNADIYPLIQTRLQDPLTFTPYGHCVYFRTRFNIPAEPRNAILTLTTRIDDGAGFYLNGALMTRVRVTASQPGYTTAASGSPPTTTADATVDEIITVTPTNLVVGENVLAVSLHNANFSSDLVFGCAASVIIPDPIVITNQPKSQMVESNSYATLAVGVSGSRPTFQWQFKNSNIAGATNATYTVSATTASVAGDYRVIIANSMNRITSAVATLTVVPDATPVTLVSGLWHPTTNKVLVTFSEPIQAASAGVFTNYAVTLLGTSERIEVTEIKVFTFSVLLTVASRQMVARYAVAVNGVKDVAGNLIAPDSRVGIGITADLVAADAQWNWSEDFDLSGQNWAALDYNESTNDFRNGGEWKIPTDRMTIGGEGFDWWVDSVNGSDANDGISFSTPFKTIAKLMTKTFTIGIRIGLARGSHWREQLNLFQHRVEVSAYGAGSMPLLDCSDVVATSWAKTTGQTNCYETTISFSASNNAFMSVWENSNRLVYATSIGQCDTNPGSYYCVTTATSPSLLYVHPLASGGDPTTNGHVFEYSRRMMGINADHYSHWTNIVLRGIHTRRNLSDSGSLLFHRFGYDLLASEGTKHCINVAGGSYLYNVVAQDAYFNAGITLFVYNDDYPAGKTVIFDNCSAMSSTSNHLVEGFYGHPNYTGNYALVKWINPKPIGCFYGINGEATNFVIDGGVISNCVSGMNVQNQFVSITNMTVSTWNSGLILREGCVTAVVEGCIFAGQKTGPSISSLGANNVVVRNSYFTNEVPAGVAILLNTAGSTLSSYSNTFVAPSDATVYWLEGSTNQYSGDYNYYAFASRSYAADAVGLYVAQTDWPAATGEDTNAGSLIVTLLPNIWLPLPQAQPSGLQIRGDLGVTGTLTGSGSGLTNASPELATNNAVATDAWNSIGRGFFYFYGFSGPIVSPKNTVLHVGSPTFYFRTRFVAPEGFMPQATIKLISAVDDGAVFYLNGTEFYRRNMPAGMPGFSTRAASEVGSAPSWATNSSLVVSNLVAGTNVLAVELHPFSTDPADYYGISFSAALSATIVPDLSVTGAMLPPKSDAYPGTLRSSLTAASPFANPTTVAPEPPVAGGVSNVIHISFDGGAGYWIESYVNTAPDVFSNLYRFQVEGSATYNARCDATYAITVPNHISMLTGRPVEQPTNMLNTVHHGFLMNSAATYDDGSTIHNSGNTNVAYKTSVFDVAHDHGLSTEFIIGKGASLTICDRSYNAKYGAPDMIPPDNGRDKIDYSVVADSYAEQLVSLFLQNLKFQPPKRYTFLHFADADKTGHMSDWGSTAWSNTMVNLDQQIGRIMDAVRNDPLLSNQTAVIVTADHGGSGQGHWIGDGTRVIQIPLLLWGPGIPAGVDLYSLFSNRADPDTNWLDYSATPQPLRNGDTGNLALNLLGLPSIPGSLMIPKFAWDEPSLALQSTNAALLVSWSGYATNFQLEASASLDPGATWTPVTDHLSQEAGRCLHTGSTASGENRFYRLRKVAP